MRLAVLIPSLTEREQLLNRLVAELDKQRKGLDVIIIINQDNREKTTGQKRNECIEKAIENNADYISFVDDDDGIGPTYIQRGVEVANSGMDCGELWGQIYWKGKKGMPFHHYLGCTRAWQDNKQYHRPPNHLNFMNLDLIKDFKFQNKNFGEDMTWAMEIQKANTFKTMYHITEIIYYYYVGEPKHEL